MKIQILGTGCPKCMTLENNARDAVIELNNGAEVEKVSDIDKIMDMGVMVTPALAINGVVKSTGKVLTKDQIKSIINKI